jgi:hypothetical protein
MAVVQGIREKIHAPLYDAIVVEPGKQLRDAVRNGAALKLFVDVQEKTKLHTNLQSASLLPHYNTFEARAMRVVISDLPADFPDKAPDQDTDFGLPVEDDDENPLFVDSDGKVITGTPGTSDTQVTAAIRLSLRRVMELLREARDAEDFYAQLDPDDEAVTLTPANADVEDVAENGSIWLSAGVLESYIDDLPDRLRPPAEQIRPRDGAGDIIGKLIYNTVTTLYVGEKIMVQAPTWLFPAGAGPYSETGKFTTHGEPNPLATFRFAEPIYIDKQQNFRVELEVPDADVFSELKQLYGPLYIWVVLDGYMTRDVQ